MFFLYAKRALFLYVIEFFKEHSNVFLSIALANRSSLTVLGLFQTF